ncbi:MAG: DUF6783 domain-containing protein [Ruminococcus sp.]|uniref:DUF6783 domain-containing protein n=1 Tax=Clostridia TaxID=186801 RepID=UPI0034A2EA39
MIPANCDAHLAESLFQTRSNRQCLFTNIIFMISKPTAIHKSCEWRLFTWDKRNAQHIPLG